MRELAVLLTEDNSRPQASCVANLLQFFGISSRNLTAAKFSPTNRVGDPMSAKLRVFCSAEVLLKFIEDSANKLESLEQWGEYVHSGFVYPGNDPDALQKLAKLLTGDDRAVLCKIDTSAEDFVVSDQLDDFCGVMSGLRFAACRANADNSVALHTTNGSAIPIISASHGAVFVKLQYKGVAIFLSTSRNIIDIEAELASRNFDVRDHLLSTVPAVLYVKWAFAKSCWKAPEANACLVIDDPLLKPTYGLINFRKLLELMERYRFSTNIAFIPWNWRRSNPKVVRLFKENREKYSLSIHGCDHTAAEFGSHDRNRLRHKARQAADRMAGHESRTGLRHERIMVFPQGVFSETAIDVLKRTNFTAVVNTEVIGTAPRKTAIRISDLWDVAVMGYGCFPIFTRRYPSQGVENFAFDILLGKPCIVVIHHDFCRDHYAHLLDFIERVNALKCQLTWRSLGDVVRRSCRQRELLANVVEAEMYGTELRLENRSEKSRRFIIRRRESDPSAIRAIHAESRQIAWKLSEGYIDFEIELNPGECTIVKLTFHELNENGQGNEGMSYRAKTMMRRYLSEMRDNYITTTRSRLADFVSR